MRAVLHIILHFAVPAAVAGIAFRKRFWTSFLVMVATMLVDLDHLLATPIYQPDRCSIGFHPLHTEWAVAAYFLLLFPRQTRMVGIGLLIHMALDLIDCWWMKCC
ncbi:MAG: DUF6122 family protein [Bacteroidota bacterium]